MPTHYTDFRKGPRLQFPKWIIPLRNYIEPCLYSRTREEEVVAEAVEIVAEAVEIVEEVVVIAEEVGVIAAEVVVAEAEGEAAFNSRGLSRYSGESVPFLRHLPFYIICTNTLRDGKFPSPNQNVTKTEDNYMAQKPTLAGSMASMAVTADFPTRPAYGTRGKPVVLWANYFELEASKKLIIYRYHVAVSPEAKGRKLKRVIELLLEDPRLKGSATDFKAILVSRKKLADVEVEVPYRAELEDDPKPVSSPYRVRVQFTGEMNIDGLVNHLRSVQPDPNFRLDNKLQIIQTLNVLLGHCPQSDPLTTTIASNKHFFFGTGQVGNRHAVECDLGKGLTALRGYFRSARPSTGRILVNVNVSHAVFFRPGPLEELINIFAAAYGRNLFQLERFLKKVRVETTHLPVKKNKAGKKIPKVKTIIALATQNDGAGLPHPPRVARFGANAKEVQFWLEPTDKKKSKNGRYITVSDFFKTRTWQFINPAPF